MWTDTFSILTWCKIHISLMHHETAHQLSVATVATWNTQRFVKALIDILKRGKSLKLTAVSSLLVDRKIVQTIFFFLANCEPRPDKVVPREIKWSRAAARQARLRPSLGSVLPMLCQSIQLSLVFSMPFPLAAGPGSSRGVKCNKKKNAAKCHPLLLQNRLGCSPSFQKNLATRRLAAGQLDVTQEGKRRRAIGKKCPAPFVQITVTVHATWIHKHTPTSFKLISTRWLNLAG